MKQVAKGFVYYTMDLAKGTDFRSYIREGTTTKERVQRCINAAKPITYAIAIMHRAGLTTLI